MKPIRTLIATAVAAIAIVAAPTPSHAADSSVVVIGDSISALNATTITRSLDRCGHATAVEAQAGRMVTRHGVLGTTDVFSAEAVLTSLIARGVDADVWMVEVGTNELWGDRLHYSTANERIGIILDLLDGERVVWTNTNIDPTHDGYRNSIIWNAALRRAERAGLIELVDWDDVDSGVLYDGVHPTPDGAATLAGLWCDHLRSA